MSEISDWQATTQLLESGPGKLAVYILYKACVAFAINGQKHDSEVLLDSSFRLLLEARRLLKKQDWEKAESILNSQFSIPSKHERYFELMGDRHYLLGLLLHRQNKPEKAEEQMIIASEFYSKGNDRHRLLRCLINRKICCSTLNSHIQGDLYFLKQKAFSMGFKDLVGNIEKAAVSEWLVAGNWEAALRSSEAAIEAYRSDGCPEDRSLAHSLKALCLFLCGQKQLAKDVARNIAIRDGKVEFYLFVLRDLFMGKLPRISKGHPLAEVKWIVSDAPKANSIPGKVLQFLSDQPMERDELICSIWGEGALDPSYCSRLYSVIRDLRHKYKIDITFDGEKYRLIS